MKTVEILLQNKFGVRPRFVEKRDAQFILDLRLDFSCSRFISKTVDDIGLQEEWIERYKQREKEQKEFYFIFEGSNDRKFGVYRIYNLDDMSFEPGSWLFSADAPEGLSLLADLYARNFAFEHIPNMQYCRFEVRKENKSVVNYHKRFMPELVGENDLNFYFKLTKKDYIKFRNTLIKIYTNGTQ